MAKGGARARKLASRHAQRKRRAQRVNCARAQAPRHATFCACGGRGGVRGRNPARVRRGARARAKARALACPQGSFARLRARNCARACFGRRCCKVPATPPSAGALNGAGWLLRGARAPARGARAPFSHTRRTQQSATWASFGDSIFATQTQYAHPAHCWLIKPRSCVVGVLLAIPVYTLVPIYLASPLRRPPFLNMLHLYKSPPPVVVLPPVRVSVSPPRSPLTSLFGEDKEGGRRANTCGRGRGRSCWVEQLRTWAGARVRRGGAKLHRAQFSTRRRAHTRGHWLLGLAQPMRSTRARTRVRGQW